MELKIREVRESRELSTYDVAKLMKIPQATYSRFERGASKIDLERLEQFATVMGLSVIDVLVWPKHYIDVEDIPSHVKAYEPDVLIQLKVRGDKRQAVLKAVLGNESVELLKS